MDSIAKLGRSSGEGNGNLLQYSCLEITMNRGAWQAIVHRVANSQTGQAHAIMIPLKKTAFFK